MKRGSSKRGFGGSVNTGLAASGSTSEPYYVSPVKKIGGGKSMKGQKAPVVDPELDRHRAHTQLLPMVMESMNYGPLIPSHRKFLKVLVVHSHPDVLSFFDNYLTLKGCEVLSMSDGHLANDALLVEDFDIAFIELTMPNFDGISLIRSFREMVDADKDEAAGLSFKKEEVKNEVSQFQPLVASGGNSRDDSPGVSMLQTDTTPTVGDTEPHETAAVERKDSGMGSMGHKPVMTYNPNMLIIGMESVPFRRSPEAAEEGMMILCPMPIDVRFVGRVVQIWREVESVKVGLDEINAHPPSTHDDEYTDNSTSRRSMKPPKDETPEEKERRLKRKERREEKKIAREAEKKNARDGGYWSSGPCAWFAALIGFNSAGNGGRRRRGQDKVYIK